MLGQVEFVHCARDRQIAIRVENFREALPLVFQVRLDFETWLEIARRARGLGHPLAAEALLPLSGRSVGDRAELAREPHAEARTATGFVVAAMPGGVAAHHFALQRAQRYGKRRRAGGA